MKLVQGVLRYVNVGFSPRLQMIRTLSTSPTSAIDADQSTNSSESSDDFERRIFGDIIGGSMNSNSYQKRDRLEKDHDRSGLGSKFNDASRSEFLDGLDESFSTLSDGMDGKLKKAATYFEYDPEEVSKDDYQFRPDVNFWSGNTYDIKDIDITKPGICKPARKRFEFQVTSEEVLRKADFREIKFGAT